MKINPVNLLNNIIGTNPASQADKSEKAPSSTPLNDSINVSLDSKFISRMSDKIMEQDPVRPNVMKRYAEFVKRPLSVADQNILSALKKSVIS